MTPARPSLSQQQTFWIDTLSPPLPQLRLPLDYPRPPVQSFFRARQRIVVHTPSPGQLLVLGRAKQATLFSLLLTGLGALLWRYTAQEDIIVGTLSPDSQSENQTQFVNPIALRLRPTRAATGQTLIQHVAKTVHQAAPRRDYPFEQLVDKLAPTPDLSRAPIFQLMFVPLDVAMTPAMPPLTASQLAQADAYTTACDMLLLVEPGQGNLTFTCEYDTALFDAETIRRLLSHWQTLLVGLVANPATPIANLPLLSQAERQQLLVDWNQTSTGPPQPVPIHRLFERQAEKTPAAPALIFGPRQLSYRQLNRQANKLAHQLHTLGIGPEKTVALCLEKGPDMLVGLLATLKAGGAYLPLDPAYPPERLAYMLDDSQAPVLLTQQRLLDRLPPYAGHTICLDAAEPASDRSGAENPASTVHPDNLAYIIYTSGSTGQPKGVMIPHRGLSNYATWATQAYNLAQGRGAPVHSSISFDLTITSLFLPLLAGQSVTLLPDDATGLSLANTLKEQSHFSLVKLTPAHLDMLSQQLTPQEAAGRTHHFIIGGEALKAGSLTFWQTHAPQTTLINEYGPTETVVGCCIYQIPAGSPPTDPVPIGRPIANTRLYLLDHRLQPVPVGIPGQLYVGGAGVGRGYLNRPGLTAERFIPDPFSDTPGARLYKTGDLARYRSDGNLEFLGRRDHQIKLRGYRIELGEIEAVLSRHPRLQEAVVTLHQPRPQAGQQLVAYVVPVAGPNPAPGQLKQFLQRTLPDYMLPTTFITVDHLPLTPNGKIDRDALPAPDTGGSTPAPAHSAPRTPTENRLAQIWADLLGLAQVDIHQNFFELGGDSILNIQMVARANQAGLKLSPHQIFQHPTIAQLATVTGPALASGAPQEPVTGPLPLTPIQHWFFEQDLPHPHHWNQSMLLEIAHPLDIDRLEQAMQQLLIHHDALRLRFSQTGSGWQQLNAPPGQPVSIERIDLSGHPATAQKDAMQQAAAQIQAGLDLANGPLMRVAYFDFGPQQPARLLWVIHHLAVDRVSWHILLEDLQTAYHQLGRGEPLQLPAKTTAYRQWATQLTNLAHTGSLRAELDHWRAGPWEQVAPLQTDFPPGRPANSRGSARVITVQLDAAETDALLKDIHHAYHTHINDILLAALAQALLRWRNTPPHQPLLIALEGHGREEIGPQQIDLSRTVGWFTAIFPLLLRPDSLQQPGPAITSIKAQLRRVPNRGVGYGLLRYLNADSGGVLKALPQPEIALNYMGQLDPLLTGSELFTLLPHTAGPNHSPQGLRPYLLEIEGYVINGQLRLDWIYSRNVHTEKTVTTLAHQFVDALRQLIAHCQAVESGDYTPADFPEAGLTQAELDELLTDLDEID